MTWIVHLVGFCVVLSSYNVMCDSGSLEEFLQEKQMYLQEVDRLFYTFYFNNTSHQLSSDANTNEHLQTIRSQPLPSPDWSSLSETNDYVTDAGEETDEDDLDTSQPTFFEEENYRPRVRSDGRPERVEDIDNRDGDENMFSGDSDLFLKEKVRGDDEEYEDFGSGDSRMEDTTPRQTTLVLQETSTSVPIESNNAVHFQCGAHLKTEITSCVELSLNVRTLLHEMSLYSVAESGYYNVTSNKYFWSLFITCVSTISRPPSCPSNNNIVKLITDGVIDFTHRHNVDDNFYGNVDQKHFDCFHTHLQLLLSCLNVRLPNVRLEKLVRMVIIRTKVASVQECQDLKEVQQCVVGSMSKCEDFTSVTLVEDMFDVTAGEIKPCGVKVTKSGNNAAVGTSLGTVLTLALSVLVLGFHKQLHN